jgi:hypothetical protein
MERPHHSGLITILISTPVYLASYAQLYSHHSYNLFRIVRDMLIFRTVALLSAALRASSYLLPRQVQGSIDPGLLETQQDDEIEENDYNVTTRIGSFKGCSDSQASDIRQAWKDAMMIANAVGDPAKIQPTSWLFFDFFGNYKREISNWEQKWRLVQGETSHTNGALL